MVYVILADGFEEIEAIEPVDIMRRSGIDVQTVSIMDTPCVNGAHGIKINADIMINDLISENMDMLVLPGGEGHKLLDASNDVHALINYALTHGKYIAAICAAPSILGKKQLLAGKKATCYPGFERCCYGAKITGDKVSVDGKIITGRGPGAAADFAFELTKILKSRNISEELKDAMQYND